jgi:hypothetical protein
MPFYILRKQEDLCIVGDEKMCNEYMRKALKAEKYEDKDQAKDIISFALEVFDLFPFKTGKQISKNSLKDKEFIKILSPTPIEVHLYENVGSDSGSSDSGSSDSGSGSGSDSDSDGSDSD